jgi:ssDNA-binding Zn-finger/Zn-ribbon topoisomerase 1
MENVWCPLCGAKMVLRMPKPSQYFKPFYGCNDYPVCRGTRNIMKNGKPELFDGEKGYQDNDDAIDDDGYAIIEDEWDVK